MNFSICYNGKPLIFNHIRSLSTRVEIAFCEDDEILLAYRTDSGNNSFSILSAKELPIGALAGKKIFNHEFLHEHLQSAIAFEVLRNAVQENTDISKLNQKTVVLIIYFYFTDTSLSVTQMTDWLIESGVAADESENLAMAIYLAATERPDDDLIFINEKQNDISFSSEPEFTEIHRFNTINDFFNHTFSAETGKTSLLFDDYQQYSKPSGDNNQEFYNCGEIPETSFLVEDHNHLILGLSCSLAEVMSIYEFSAPEIYSFIRQHSSFSDRTLKSLGGFLEEFYSEILDLLDKTGIHCSIKLLDNQHKTVSIGLIDFNTAYGFSFYIPGYLPVFMDVEKARQTFD